MEEGWTTSLSASLLQRIKYVIELSQKTIQADLWYLDSSVYSQRKVNLWNLFI